MLWVSASVFSKLIKYLRLPMRSLLLQLVSYYCKFFRMKIVPSAIRGVKQPSRALRHILRSGALPSDLK